jgi:hypothetical protein
MTDDEEQQRPGETRSEGEGETTPSPRQPADRPDTQQSSVDPTPKPTKPPAKPVRDIATIRAAAARDPLAGGLGHAMRELEMQDRIAREIGLIRNPIDDLLMGRHSLSTVERALADARHTISGAIGISTVQDAIARASAGIGAVGGIDTVMRRHREMERTILGLGGLDAIGARHSAMADAMTVLGGFDTVLRRHDEMSRIGLASTAAAELAQIGSASFAANKAMEQAMRDIAGVTSFTGLLSHSLIDRAQFEALISGTQRWREEARGLSLTATLHAQMPDLIPERRRVTVADIAGATLSDLGVRYARDAQRFARLHEEMLAVRRPWVDVGNPEQSVAAYVDARALADVVAAGPPESRAVVAAVREELGDYRETEPVGEVVAADPVLRAAFRLEVGYNADLSSLPPAIIAAIFSGFGGVPRNIEADPDALASAVHQRARRLELKLRRFIEKKMAAVAGPKWSKQRVRGEVVTRWRARRQLDIDNGRTPSRIFDYAGFEDYREIIEQKDNWEQVFAPVFKVKTSILETLRRLSLIRNPDAHYRIMTIEDLIDLHAEGRRLDVWLDAAS